MSRKKKTIELKFCQLEGCMNLMKEKSNKYCCISHCNQDRVGNKHPMYGVSRFGKENPMYGKKHTKESKDKMREKAIGRLHSEGTKKLFSKQRKGVKNPMFGRRGESSPNFGRKHTNEYKELMRRYKTDIDFHMDNLITKDAPKYRVLAFEHYGVKCENCGKERAIFEVHHLDGNHYNDDINNLSVLCIHCHQAYAHNKTNNGSGWVTTLNEEFTKKILKARINMEVVDEQEYKKHK